MAGKKIIFSFVLLWFSGNYALSQISFNYGLEAGISFSRLPKFDKYSDNIRIVKERFLPLPGPLIGFHGQLDINNRISLGVGLQYQLTGRRYKTHRESRIPGFGGPSSISTISEKWENETFHKVCLPLTLGYAFKVWNIQVSVFAGFRPNYFIKGKSYYKLDIDSSDNSRDFSRVHEYDPVDPEEAYKPTGRFSHQVFIGTAFTLGRKLELAFSFNQGWLISYAEYQPYGGESNTTSFDNADWIFSLKYLMKG